MIFYPPLLAAFDMLEILLQAYYPSRLLLLHDGTEYIDFMNLLGGIEMEIDKFEMTSKFFELPPLFEEGSPVYSHVVIVGDAHYLSKDVQTKLARYVDGADDPDFSRFSNYEKETLTFNPDAKGLFGEQFDKYPGAHLLVITSSELTVLMEKLGVVYDKYTSSDEVRAKFEQVFPNTNSSNMTSYFSGQDTSCVRHNFKNPRNTFIGVFERGDCSPVAVWRGVKNNARVAFIGSNTFLSDAEQMDDVNFLLYDVTRWFGLHDKLLRAMEFTYTNLDLPENSECRKNLYLAEYTEGTVREGGLVLIKLTVNELREKTWGPYKGAKMYKSFEEMVQKVGFFAIKNSNHTSVMKKQTKSFNENYELCMSEILGPNYGSLYHYTDVQAFEQFIEHWYAVNMVASGNGTFYALLEPDLVRTYSIMFDIDRNEYNRISAVQTIDAHVDRYEENKFTLQNGVWQIVLILNVVLGFYAVWLMLTTKDSVLADAKTERKN